MKKTTINFFTAGKAGFQSGGSRKIQEKFAMKSSQGMLNIETQREIENNKTKIKHKIIQKFSEKSQ